MVTPCVATRQAHYSRWRRGVKAMWAFRNERNRPLSLSGLTGSASALTAIRWPSCASSPPPRWASGRREGSRERLIAVALGESGRDFEDEAIGAGSHRGQRELRHEVPLAGAVARSETTGSRRLASAMASGPWCCAWCFEGADAALAQNDVRAALRDMHSALISYSSIVAERPRLSSGMPVRPTSSSSWCSACCAR